MEINEVDIINLLCDKIGIAVNWNGDRIDELMPKIQELITQFAAGRYAMWLTLCISFAILTIGMILLIVFRKHFYDEDFASFCGVVFGLAFAAITITAACYMVQWKLSPEIMSYRWIINAISSAK